MLSFLLGRGKEKEVVQVYYDSVSLLPQKGPTGFRSLVKIRGAALSPKGRP